MRLKQYYVNSNTEGSNAEKVAKTTEVSSKNESGSEKENGIQRSTPSKKSKKRKILEDSDDDDDEDYSPTKKPSVNSPKLPKNEVKPAVKKLEKPAEKAKEKPPKEKIKNGVNHERENASKLFPRVTLATSSPQKVSASPQKIEKSSETSENSATKSIKIEAKGNSIAAKIEVSTPKEKSFDVLGSIMKDMTK